MERNFHTTLAALRRERHLNQRQVASDLQISQALLSHYENGTREPGLAFVCRACDYYGVSADYLLGRCDETNATAAVLTARTYLCEMSELVNKASAAVSFYEHKQGD